MEKWKVVDIESPQVFATDLDYWSAYELMKEKRHEGWHALMVPVVYSFKGKYWTAGKV